MKESLQAMVKREARRRMLCAAEPTEFEAMVRRADSNWSFVYGRVYEAHEALWPFGRLTPKQLGRITRALRKET